MRESGDTGRNPAQAIFSKKQHRSGSADEDVGVVCVIVLESQDSGAFYSIFLLHS
jgi:hypothetical protein